MRRILIAVLSRLRVLEIALSGLSAIRSLGGAARAMRWRRAAHAASASSDFVVVRERSGVWMCSTRDRQDPVELFSEAFEQCLQGLEEFEAADFGILEREGGNYPAIEISPAAWAALLEHWAEGAAAWNLHVQLPSQRSHPESLRIASEQTRHKIARWEGRVIVFAAVAHPSSPLPVGRSLGVDVFVRPQIDPRRKQRPWGDVSLTAWITELRRPPFPIDAVYTWVDDSDPAWVERRLAAQPDEAETATDSASSDRYANRDELRYSLRSLALYAEWFDRVCLVTDDQTPAWADGSLEIVDHREILNHDALPTFNSHAIEAGMHRVHGLHEHYVYLNDDVFFDGPIAWSLLFTPEGKSRFFLSQAIIPKPGREEKTIDNATSNGRSLLQRELGLVISQKMKHTPQTQRRSVHEWMESEFPEEHRTTAMTQFRSVSDQSFASFLHHYVAFTLGKAEPGRNLRYDYFNAADGRLGQRLAFLRDRPGLFHTYCVNDGEVADADRSTVDAQIRRHLRTALPFPTSWEAQGG